MRRVFLNFKQDEAFLAALMQKKRQIRLWPGYDLLVVLDLSVRTQIEIFIRYILISILRRYHSLSQLHRYHPWRGTCYIMSFHYVMHIFWWSLSNIVYRRTVDVYGPPSGTCRDSMFSVMVLQTQVSYPYSRISSWILENVHLMT